MSNTAVALALTALYWTAAIIWAVVTPRGGWIDLRWFSAIVVGAIPATALLWLGWLGFRFAGRPRMPTALSLFGLAVPVVYLVSLPIVAEVLRARTLARTAGEIAATLITDFNDEPLLSASGMPIGVRVGYRVTFRSGLSDPKFSPQLNLHHPNPASNFMILRQTVTPPLSDPIAAGTYAVTLEFVPYFLPAFLIFPERSASSVPADRCFRWGGASLRDQILAADAQALSISLQDYLPAPRSTTARYRMADFHAGALKDGATDCVGR
jgi:hypothetical protein